MNSSPESFGQIFKLEKVQSWENSYINYDQFINDIKNIVKYLKMIIEESKTNKIVKNKELLNNNPKIKKIGGHPTLFASININNINNNDDNNFSLNKAINKNLEEEHKKAIEEKIKLFFQSLDKEIKKIYIFFSTKEKDIYQKINKKIQN